MKGNFLAQFSGPAPDNVVWWLEICVNGVNLHHTSTNLKHALNLSAKLRQLYPQASIRMKVDAFSDSMSKEG